MQINNPSSKIRISDREPTDYSTIQISLNDISTSLDKFINQFFGGTITVSSPKIAMGYVKIAPSRLAYLIKVLVNQYYSDNPPKTSINIENEGLSITVEYCEQINDTDTLKKIFESAGLVLQEESERSLHYFSPALTSKSIRVYAGDPTFLYAYLLEVFFV